MKRRIICAGAVVCDEVYYVDTLPAAGIKIGASRYEERFGGPAATAAVAIANLQGTVSYWGRVGTDPKGDAALSALRGHGVDCEAVAVVTGGRTRSAVVMVDNNGERCLVTYRKGLPDDASLVPADPLAEVAVVLADSRWPVGAETIIARASSNGIPSVIDMDGGERTETERLVAKADHVIFSAEGLSDFAGEGSPADQLRACGLPSTKVVAVTQGAAGSLWWWHDQLVPVPAFQVKATDTTGCGDVFHGAYALALCDGLAPLAAARFASAVAAVKAVRGRGWDGMPDRRSVEELLATSDGGADTR